VDKGGSDDDTGTKELSTEKGPFWNSESMTSTGKDGKDGTFIIQQNARK